jgi:hypothetical protein
MKDISEAVTQDKLEVPYNPHMLVTYKAIAGTYAEPESPTYLTDKVTDIEWALHNMRVDKDAYYKLRSKISGLEEQVVEWANPNYDKDEVIAGICEYFNINPTKQVTVTGTISYEVTIDIPLNEVEDFDADYLLGDELSVDSNSSNISVDNWTLDSADVDWG